MNSYAEKVHKEDKTEPQMHQKVDPLQDPNLEQQIIKTIYAKYGKPNKIVKEKLTLYLGRQTPTGWVQPAWNEGGWQRGRYTVFVSYQKEGLEHRRIDGSWFFKTDGKILRVCLDKQPEDVLEIIKD